MSSVGKNPEWINFADAPPKLQYVECGGRLGEERAALFEPDKAEDGQWISLREDALLTVSDCR